MLPLPLPWLTADSTGLGGGVGVPPGENGLQREEINDSVSFFFSSILLRKPGVITLPVPVAMILSRSWFAVFEADPD